MYRLHFAPDNASLAVRLVLEELGAPYQGVALNGGTGAAADPVLRAVNPAGLIPALETPHGPLFETAAILLWLADTHGRLAPQPGSAERGAFLSWLFFVSNTFHADLRLLFYAERYAGDVGGIAAHGRATRGRIARHVALLDDLARSGADWFTASPSVLSYYACVCLRWLPLYPAGQPEWFRLTEYPALLAIARALETTPAALRSAGLERLGPTPFSAPVSPA